ncbi:MAG TPA: hypothetical protein VJB87_03160 [Candidatus Nanoarchaeia archaeon]|nr:hypothetical protein [Candidatus Nanoarchaeia archaeon]
MTISTTDGHGTTPQLTPEQTLELRLEKLTRHPLTARVGDFLTHVSSEFRDTWIRSTLFIALGIAGGFTTYTAFTAGMITGAPEHREAYKKVGRIKVLLHYNDEVGSLKPETIHQLEDQLEAGAKSPSTYNPEQAQAVLTEFRERKQQLMQPITTTTITYFTKLEEQLGDLRQENGGYFILSLIGLAFTAGGIGTIIRCTKEGLQNWRYQRLPLARDLNEVTHTIAETSDQTGLKLRAALAYLSHTQDPPQRQLDGVKYIFWNRPEEEPSHHQRLDNIIAGKITKAKSCY